MQSIGPGNAAGALSYWARAHHVQRDGNTLPFGLDGIQAPQVYLQLSPMQLSAQMLCILRAAGRMCLPESHFLTATALQLSARTVRSTRKPAPNWH